MGKVIFEFHWVFETKRETDAAKQRLAACYPLLGVAKLELKQRIFKEGSLYGKTPGVREDISTFNKVRDVETNVRDALRDLVRDPSIFVLDRADDVERDARYFIQKVLGSKALEQLVVKALVKEDTQGSVVVLGPPR